MKFMKLPLLIYKEKKEKFDYSIKKSEPYSDNLYMEKISTDFNQNLEYVNKKLSSDINGDIVIRKFVFYVGDKKISSVIMCVDGLSSSEFINNFILKPLMELRNYKNGNEQINIDFIIESLIPHGQVKKTDDINTLISDIAKKEGTQKETVTSLPLETARESLAPFS